MAKSSSSSSSRSSSSHRKKKIKKQKNNKKKKREVVSPSVSNPRNRNKIKKKKRSSSVDSALPDTVLPLLLEHVQKHTKKMDYSVDKEDTVDKYFNTIINVRGDYFINQEPVIEPIPTPVPPSGKKKKKKERDKEETISVSSSDSSAHIDSGMFTETTSRHGRETKLLRAKIERQYSDDNGFQPLDSKALKKKFQAMLDLGTKQIKDEQSKAFKDEYQEWCKKNGEKFVTPVAEFAPQPSAAQRKKPDIKLEALIQNKSDSGLGKSETPSASKLKRTQKKLPVPTRTKTPKPSPLPLKNEPEPERTKSPTGIPQKPVFIQAKKPPIAKKKFSIPDILTLDGYTQTNDKERLGTTPIKRLHKQVQGFSLPETFSEHQTSRGMQTGLHATFSIKGETNEPVDDDEHVQFAIKDTCRHGNKRNICEQCQNSVVARKFTNQPLRQTPQVEALQEDFTKPTPTPRSLPTPQQTRPVPAPRKVIIPRDISPIEDRSEIESVDSGRNSDSAEPVISEKKLLTIRNLAKAKLKQIKSDPKKDKSLERTSSSAELPLARRKPNKKKLQEDGTEVLGLQDLPPLVANRKPNTVFDKVVRLQETKREADVHRARSYIQHCLESPIIQNYDSKKSQSLPRRSYDKQEHFPDLKQARRCESEATNMNRKQKRTIADDVASRKCVSEVQDGTMNRFDVNYKAYIHALERIVDSNLSSLMHTELHDKYQ